MKSEKGVTITSLIIYVIALTIVVIVLGRIITYFYKNVNDISSNAESDVEYMKFNTYFTDEINVEGNAVEMCEGTYIIFSKTKNQYTYQNGSIYINTTKISKNLESCEFSYNEDTEEITVTMTISGKIYSNTYTIVK